MLISRPSVAEKLPELRNLAWEIATGLEDGTLTGWETLTPQYKRLLHPGIVERMEGIIPGWRKIATLHDGMTARHTLMVLATCLTLDEYWQSAPQIRLELEWAVVLHNLDKTVAHNDTAHPFRSAALAAGVMP